MTIGIGSGPTRDQDGNDVYQLVCSHGTGFCDHSGESLGTVAVSHGSTPLPSYLACAQHTAVDAYCGSTPISLAHAQALACAQIDARTRTLLAQGFAVGGVTVPLDMGGPTLGLLRWFGLNALAGSLSYPIVVAAADNASTLSIPNPSALASAAASIFAHVLAVVNAGDALKVQALGATDAASLLAVVDAR